jgi:hypothetical protein
MPGDVCELNRLHGALALDVSADRSTAASISEPVSKAEHPARLARSA